MSMVNTMPLCMVRGIPFVSHESEGQEFSAILGRMATLYKRQSDLVLPKAALSVDFCVLNYDIKNPP